MPRYKTTPEAYRLLHEGTIALAEVEAAGCRVDWDYLNEQIASVGEQIRDAQNELKKDSIWRTWKNLYGDKANLGSHDQLGKIVFGQLGYQPLTWTETTKDYENPEDRRAKTDEEAFEHVDEPFVRLWVRVAKLDKLLGTYLKGIHEEAVQHDGNRWIHPIYNLNTVSTFRSSCRVPNWQNIYARNPEFAEIVRRAYIPRDGYQIVEIDEGQIEVRVAATYNFDPNLINYILDPKTDMHRDMAQQIFCFSPKEWAGLDPKVAKALRHIAKNKFVFPEFYGDFYPRCAHNMWKEFSRLGLGVGPKTILDGVDEDGNEVLRSRTVAEHLANHGISALGLCDPDESPAGGTFEKHVQEIEDDFWHERFPVYTAWKKSWYDRYQRTGGFQMHTGFGVNAFLKRNDVINYPIQGSSFHILLWALIRLVNWLRRYKMKSRVIGQIHDNIVGDVHPRERDDYIAAARHFMTIAVRKHWEWINVPLDCEVEIAAVDASWYEKRVHIEEGGTWIAKA